MNKEEIQHLGTLARVKLSEKEVERFEKEITAILGYVGTIDEVPTALERILASGDFLMTQGAGETAKLARTLTERWESRRVL